MFIAYFEGEAWERGYLRDKLPEHDLKLHEGPIKDNHDSASDEIEALSIFVKSKIGAKEFEMFPNLKFIATRSTGFDHVDVEEAKKRGIVVSNIPAYGDNTVAEFAFALLLAVSRKVYDAYKQIEETGSFSQVGLRGFDLCGKTVGVVGCGRIGRRFIEMARGFGMNILVYDIYQDANLASLLGFKYVPFDELLSSSDIISIHAPYNKQTHHLINSKNIFKIKKGSYLINTARGGLVETKALVLALEKGIIAGAGLDVLEEEGFMGHDEIELLHTDHPNKTTLETMLSNHYFIDHPRVIVTPHIAFNTKEALERIIDATIENIKAFTNGKPINVVS